MTHTRLRPATRHALALVAALLPFTVNGPRAGATAPGYGSVIDPQTAATAAATPTRTMTGEQRDASFDAHKGDFDYLLGDWEFTCENRQYGKGHGYWSAVRLATGHILDEYRLVGDKGETFYVTTTLRAYNAAADRWELVGLDDGSGLQDVGTARRVGAEMHLEQRFGVTGPEPSTWRIRYYAIEADRFSWTADRRADGSQTWVTAFHTIEARRIGPPRSLEPLATGKKPAVR